jgi:flagellar basal-body rod modification protein FlgD
MDALESFGIESALAAEADRKAADDEIGQNNFLTMLVAQLENQDPMNPQDSADFAAQLAQFSSVEQLIAMRAGIDSLVAASATSAGVGNASGAAAIDPTNLVGEWVTVYGSQIEVDAARSPVELDFRSIETATEAEVVITDASGTVVHRSSILPMSETGEALPLGAGDHVYRLDPSQHNLRSGIYGVELVARDAAGEPVTLLPMVRGQVTGAILTGEPSIRLGNRIFSVQDVLEVSLAEQRTAARTGGAQQTVSSTGETPTEVGG